MIWMSRLFQLSATGIGDLIMIEIKSEVSFLTGFLI